MDGSIENLVDRLLLEQGEYLPLELLLHQGWLDYAAYEAWRRREQEHLDSALCGDPVQIRQQLAAAEEYMKRRGWRAETLRYGSWDRNAKQRSLSFSPDHGFDACFHRGYHRPDDQPQLDLFTDNPAVSLVNGIARALVDRDANEARRLLDRLVDLAPGHVRLGVLERLTETAEAIDAPVADVRSELQRLQLVLAPQAADLLGPACHNLLVPLWRRLSAALKMHPFVPAEPNLHASFTLAQARDWLGVCEAVEAVPGWREQPVLIRRHADACERRHEDARALGDWFQLCWDHPGHAGSVAASNSHELRRHWEGFQDLDPVLPPGAFPAWLLIRRPGLLRTLPEPAASSTTCPPSYATLYDLLGARSRSGMAAGPQELALRARLKQQDPRLLQCFLDAISP